MLDHIGLNVADLEVSKRFYAKALKALGIEVIIEVMAEQTGSDAYVGMGSAGKAFFWFGEGKGMPIHVAFTAPSRAVVDAFYRDALAAGGVDNGAPGLRPHYHADYYGAFVLDPDGNNIEAVCNAPEDEGA